MVRPPLNGNIAMFEQPRLPRVQQKLDLPFQHNAIIKTDCSMHRRNTSGRHVDDSQHGAAGYSQTGQVVQEGLVGAHVPVCREVDGDFVRRIS